jgi:parallel beta helix pectate lyase-like protein/pectate lyase-like protein
MIGKQSNCLLLLCVCLALAVSPSPGRATTYYVDGKDPSASDANPGTSETLPWATIDRASRTMAAGDSTYVKGGTYLVTRGGGAPTYSAERYLPALNPAHDGAPGAPIVFRAYPGDTVVIQYSPDELKRGPLIGSYRKDYIVWDGFTVVETDQNNQQDTGPVVIFGEIGDPADHVTIRDCDVQGVQATVSPASENHNALRIEQATNALIENNRLHGTRGEFHNHAAIMMYFDSDITVQNNEIYDSYTGIYVKGGNNTGVILRRNLIHGTNIGIRTSYTLNSVAYQNIIYDGTSFGGTYGSEPTKGFEFAESITDIDGYNNTVVNVERGVNVPFYQGQSGVDLRSNIFSSVTYPIYDEAATTSMFTSDYSVFNAFTAFSIGYVDQPPSQWLAAGLDQNSIVADPRFVDPAAHDYHLDPLSSARNAGIDWGDLNADGNTTDRVNAGAYVTGQETIGLENGQPPCETPPDPPRQFLATADSEGVGLTWLPPTDALATAIRIYRGAGTSGPLTFLATRNIAFTSYRDSTALGGTAYRYAAAWANPCGTGPSALSPGPVTLSGTRWAAGAAAGTSAEPSVHAFPNPSTGAIQLAVRIPGADSQLVRLRLFDLEGHWIADLYDGPMPPGENHVGWARTGRTGGRVAAGYYEAVGTVGSSRVRERIVLLP